MTAKVTPMGRLHTVRNPSLTALRPRSMREQIDRQRDLLNLSLPTATSLNPGITHDHMCDSTTAVPKAKHYE